MEKTSQCIRWLIQKCGQRWRKIWHFNAPERVRSFMWILVHDRLLTNDRKHRMGFGDAYCNHCHNKIESTIHVLRECPLAKLVWCHLVKMDRRSNFFFCDLDQWVEYNISQSGVHVDSFKWGEVWATTCHAIWTWRNKEVFDSNFIRPVRPWKEIYKRLREYACSFSHNYAMHNHDMHWIDVLWIPPPLDWVCLNTDGASKNEGAKSGCGGLLRDHNAKWICGFSKSLGSCSALVAELWGILEGLKMARDRGFAAVKVQVDAQTAACIINNHDSSRMIGWSIVTEIQKMLKLPWAVHITHIYREANRCADALAGVGCDQDSSLIFYEQYPAIIGQLLLADRLRVSTPGRILV